MATVNFSVPDSVKKAFDRAFKNQNKSAVIAELMRQAVAEAERQKRRKDIFTALTELRQRRPTATDAQIVDAMRLLFDAAGLVVEPSGACALAAVLRADLLEELGLANRRIGVILSGGNVDPDRFEALTGRTPPAS